MVFEIDRFNAVFLYIYRVDKVFDWNDIGKSNNIFLLSNAELNCCIMKSIYKLVTYYSGH